MPSNWLNIPIIQIKRVIDDNLSIVYYELWLNGKFEARYPDYNSLTWRIGLIISEEIMICC